MNITPARAAPVLPDLEGLKMLELPEIFWPPTQDDSIMAAWSSLNADWRGNSLWNSVAMDEPDEAATLPLPLRIQAPRFEDEAILREVADPRFVGFSERYDLQRAWVRPRFWNLEKRGRAPESLIELAGFSREDMAHFTLVDFNDNLGDTLIFDFGLLELLKQHFGANIHVLSSQARVLVPGEGVQPERLKIADIVGCDFTQTAAEKFFRESLSRVRAQVLGAAAAPGVVYCDFTGLRHLEARLGHAVMQAQKAGHDVNMPDRIWELREFGRELKLELWRRGNAITRDDTPVGDRMSFSRLAACEEPLHFFEIDAAARMKKFENVYQKSAMMARLLFGPDMDLIWPAELFFAEDDGSVRDFKTWRAGAFIHPQNPIALINLNTRETRKREWLKKEAVPALAEMLAFATASYPDLNIAVVPPDEAYGDELAQAMADELKKYPGVCAFLPADRPRLWDTAIRSAKFILSQDSGFSHMGYILHPQRSLMNLSLSHDRLAQQWRPPGTPYALISPLGLTPEMGRAQFHRKIQRWVRKMMQR